MEKKRRIAILTGGGDCPGMNAIVRAVAKKAILDLGYEVVGIEDGYEGLIQIGITSWNTATCRE